MPGIESADAERSETSGEAPVAGRFVRAPLAKRAKIVFFATVLALTCAVVPAWADLTPDANRAAALHPLRKGLVNGREVINEIPPTLGQEQRAAQTFIRFDRFHDVLMFHPKLGFYSKGNVILDQSEGAQFATFPALLSPFFGQMLAEHVFRMWQGMHRAGRVDSREPFLIGEVGGGDGALAHDFLTFVQTRAAGDAEWKMFWDQMRYVGFDRSKPLLKRQREMNAVFGSRFSTKQMDARELLMAIRAGSAAGVIFSNELLDVFPVTKSILGPDGTAETCHVVPSVPGALLEELKKAGLSRRLERLMRAEHNEAAPLLQTWPADHLVLSERSFSALLNFIARLPQARRQELLRLVTFAETYLPVATAPDLASYLARHVDQYALALASRPQSAVVYTKLGAERFSHQAGLALRVGYVITIDYGESVEQLFRSMGPSSSHLRVFPAPGGIQSGDPYYRPFDVDVTADINFTDVVQSGTSSGLEPVFFGPQGALASGTSVDLEAEKRRRSEADPSSATARRFAKEVDHFLGKEFSFFRLLVQQKRGTDSAYRFPHAPSLPLYFDSSGLTIEQKTRAAQMEQKLRQQLGLHSSAAP